MSLGSLLAADLIEWMGKAPDGVPRRVLLWLDPDRQFVRLEEALREEVEAQVGPVLQSDSDGGGQLRLKLELLELEARPDGRVVVYLPGFGRNDLEPRSDGTPPALWGVYDYRYKGCVWGRGDSWQAGDLLEPVSLLGWLQLHGLEVADDKTARKLSGGGSDSLLARYAVRMAKRDPDRWPRPLRFSDVEEELGGDPRETLRRLLAAPHNEVRRWGSELPMVLARLVGEYGISLPAGKVAPEGSEGPDDETLVDAIAVQLALSEAWDAFGQPADFPFLSRLPSRLAHRRRMAAFLRDDVISHTELGPKFRGRMARLEKGYDLADWVAGHHGQPAGLPLLARDQWKRFLQRFQTAAEQDWKGARDLLAAERVVISAGVSAPWDGKGGESQWGTMARLGELCQLATSAIEEANALAKALDLVSAYSKKWWKVDSLHLELRAACSSVAGLESVRRVADRAYFEYASKVNQRLAELVEEEGQWPPSGLASVEKERDSLWKADNGRLGVIICDAVRWDLGRRVEGRLSGPDHSVEAVAAVLPSETVFGMASLLPLEEAGLEADYPEGKPRVRDVSGRDLSSREARKEYLRSKLVDNNGKSIVQFVDMEALLKGEPVPKSRIVVVFDNKGDEQGHKVPEQLPLLVEQLAANLARTIELLQEAGLNTVHLVTDHGFLLLPVEEVSALGTPSVPIAQALRREYRWAALKPDAPTEDLIRIPSPFVSPPNSLGLARGVRTLVQPEPYLHGGLSLQECVIPHLTSRATFRTVRVGVKVEVTTSNLSAGTVPVVLRPVIPPEPPMFSGIQPLKLLLRVETDDEGKEPRRVSDEQAVELRSDVDELKPAVYLQEGLGLTSGQKLVLRAVDAENGRDLGKVPLTLLVDWD